MKKITTKNYKVKLATLATQAMVDLDCSSADALAMAICHLTNLLAEQANDQENIGHGHIDPRFSLP